MKNEYRKWRLYRNIGLVRGKAGSSEEIMRSKNFQIFIGNSQGKILKIFKKGHEGQRTALPTYEVVAGRRLLLLGPNCRKLGPHGPYLIVRNPNIGKFVEPRISNLEVGALGPQFSTIWPVE